MPIVPAFCNTCGTAFNSGIFAENSKNISFAGGVSGPCPKCGGMGHVPDGVFNFIGDTIEILSAPERTILELLSLAEIIKEARAKSETKDQVAARIKKELPGLSLLAKILPENKSELYGFLGVVLAAVALYTQSPEKPLTQTTINITQIVETVIVEGKKDGVQSPQATKPAKQGRNESCSCGSGMKYKKCCGVLK
jgi:hypothetical protein